jgi:hypothetical protein
LEVSTLERRVVLAVSGVGFDEEVEAYEVDHQKKQTTLTRGISSSRLRSGRGRGGGSSRRGGRVLRRKRDGEGCVLAVWACTAAAWRGVEQEWR